MKIHAIGATLLVITLCSSAVRAEEKPALPPRTSAPRMVTGIVFTGVGVLSIGASVAGYAAYSSGRGSDGSQIGGFIYGSAFLAHAVVCLAIGIPLWVSGARRTGTLDAHPSFSRVALGPTTLAWTF